MNDNTTTTDQPSIAMKRLDRLVGTWQVSGGAEGTVTYEWMEGGSSHPARRPNPVRSADPRPRKSSATSGPSARSRARTSSRFYDNQGNTLDYTYELDGDALTIWAGSQDSPAYYRGTFSADGNTATGAWVYPGGGGYESTMTRLA
jgi:hypothetical protein